MGAGKTREPKSVATLGPGESPTVHSSKCYQSAVRWRTGDGKEPEIQRTQRALGPGEPPYSRVPKRPYLSTTKTDIAQSQTGPRRWVGVLLRRTGPYLIPTLLHRQPRQYRLLVASVAKVEVRGAKNRFLFVYYSPTTQPPERSLHISEQNAGGRGQDAVYCSGLKRS